MVQSRFSDKLQSINAGIEKDGAFYLFGLRLVPLFPFFIINLVMGLTPISTWTFAWVSQVGMLLGTAVFITPVPNWQSLTLSPAFFPPV